MQELAAHGAEGCGSIAELVAGLAALRAVWVMVPTAVVGATINDLASCMTSGDIIIDGGNSYYHDDLELSRALTDKGIRFVDCGTSGGVFGLDRGFCLTIGGETQVITHLAPSSQASRQELMLRRALQAGRVSRRA